MMLTLDHLQRIQQGLPLLLLLISLDVSIAKAPSSLNIAKPGCQARCGNVEIPYPFGVGSHCSHNSWFNITCKNSGKPILTKFKVEVLEISFSQQWLRVNLPPRRYWNCEDVPTLPQLNASGCPFYYSTVKNMFVTRGCPGGIFIYNEAGLPLAGCTSVCSTDVIVMGNDGNSSDQSAGCNGIGCCQTPLPTLRYPLRDYQLEIANISYLGQTCFICALVETASIEKFSQNRSKTGVYPTILEYSVGKDLRLSPFANCSTNGQGNCQCKYGYQGNPFLELGCQVAEACQRCRGICVRMDGDSYYCESSSKSFSKESIIGIGVGAGFILFVGFCFWLHVMLKKRREIKRRTKYFHLLLHQHMASKSIGDVLDRTKLFTTRELKRATDNFSEDRILGRGGQGIVYKGMLPDGKIIAVKKPRLVDESHITQFINEVVILSQLNHRHVVKLFGCCLDTKSPLLVYEFISNGTLFDHLHNQEDCQLTWKMRLQIAAESAGATAYLHSSSSTPIFHRDIKSSNILVDEKFSSKVSDFGISRTVDIDQTHLTTCVHGTLGYLDPEYFESNQFTDKSDVYSFGVVLVELLTGRKPISTFNSVEWRSLTTVFLFFMENSRLFDIVDPRILQEATKGELFVMAGLARQCLNTSGSQRPTMRDVANILEELKSSPTTTTLHTQSQETIHTTTRNQLVQSEIFVTNSICKDSSSVATRPLLRDTV